GTIARGRLADAFGEDSTQETVHPNTYAAHPVACAAALANLQIMEKDGLVANAETMGKRLLDGLQQAVGGKRIVGEVRGRGLLVCAELVAPDGSGTPLDAAEVAKLDRKAWERGAIVYARGQVVRLAPPLCITAAEVDRLGGDVAGPGGGGRARGAEDPRERAEARAMVRAKYGWQARLRDLFARLSGRIHRRVWLAVALSRPGD